MCLVGGFIGAYGRRLKSCPRYHLKYNKTRYLRVSGFFMPVTFFRGPTMALAKTQYVELRSILIHISALFAFWLATPNMTGNLIFI